MSEGRETESRGSIVPLVLFALALAIATALVARSLSHAVVDPKSDDGYYLAYMRSVHEQGLGVLPKLFANWNADPHAWIYPPPSRVGFVVVSALWASIFGVSYASLQYLSLASYVAGALVTYVYARRSFGEPKALFIGALWLFSPLLMGLARLALTDSFIALCMSVCAWSFLELVEHPGRSRRRIVFMAAFGFTVLVKELSVLLVVPFAALVLIENFWRKEERSLATYALVLALPGAIVLPIFAAAAGGFATLLETTRIVLASPATNDYAIQYGSGPWFRYLVDFLCLSPWTTLLAIAYLGVLAARLRAGEYDRRLVFLALIAIALFFEYSFFTKNVRYAVLVELPIRVFAVSLVWELCAAATAKRGAIVCGLAIAALCCADALSFELYWVRYPGYDPVTHELAGVRHVIPYPVR